MHQRNLIHLDLIQGTGIKYFVRCFLNSPVSHIHVHDSDIYVHNDSFFISVVVVHILVLFSTLKINAKMVQFESTFADSKNQEVAKLVGIR